MKKIIFLTLLLPVLHSCDKNDLVTGKKVTIAFQSETWESQTVNAVPFHHLHLFVIDRNNTVTRHQAYTPSELQDNTLNINLPFGRYRLAFVANAPHEKDITFNVGDLLENIRLPLSSKENGEQEANDILTALQSVSISENKNTIPLIHLSRRVGRLKVTLENIPEGVQDLYAEVSFVPSSITFTKSRTDNFGTIRKKITRQEPNRGFADILAYPAGKGEANLTISYQLNNTTKQKIIEFQEAIDTNRINKVTGNFPELPEGGLQGNGVNLLENGDFEQWSNPQREPDKWRFYKDGKDSSIVKIVGSQVYSGRQSVLLQGKTYLYQDIPIIPNKRYEIKMNVNSPSISFTWKYYCYWRKTASTALPSEYNKSIQASTYLKQTEGWINVFRGKTFLAPGDAKLLRIEIRTYGKEIRPGEGIYIDDFSVELVE